MKKGNANMKILNPNNEGNYNLRINRFVCVPLQVVSLSSQFLRASQHVQQKESMNRV